MAKEIVGRRVYLNLDGELLLSPGDYGKHRSGDWLARPPKEDCHAGNLKNHVVKENADGTITVSPSILISEFQGQAKIEKWHGYLEQGVWREC